MTLYVTLNNSGELVLESDYSGSRTVLAEDTGGPTEWAWKDSWGVPERTEHLVAKAMENASSNDEALAVAKDAIVEDFADDR